MAQGKLKQKTKVPSAISKKKKNSGKAFTRRSNAPIQSKKNKFTEQQKIKEVISKAVNKSAEDELRGRAVDGKINLSKAQAAVAKNHQRASTSTNVNQKMEE